MRGNTKPYEKFNKARALVAAHPDLSEAIVNWRRMGWRALYAALAARGVAWDASAGSWFYLVMPSTASQQQVKVTPRRTPEKQEAVLVRIIASEEAINKAIAEMLEIARASNLTLLHNSRLISTHDGRSKRVYLKFLLDEKSRIKS